MSCAEQENQTVQNNQPEIDIPFDLSSDYHQFSKKLNINDSLVFYFDLRVCMGSDQAYLTFVRKLDGISLHSHLINEDLDTSFTTFFLLEDFSLDSLISNGITDSLVIQTSTKLEDQTENTECEISINSDTLYFYASPGIVSKIRHISRFETQLNSLYGEVKSFAGVEIPQKMEE